MLASGQCHVEVLASLHVARLPSYRFREVGDSLRGLPPKQIDQPDVIEKRRVAGAEWECLEIEFEGTGEFTPLKGISG
jgi:hypothetical protein